MEPVSIVPNDDEPVEPSQVPHAAAGETATERAKAVLLARRSELHDVIRRERAAREAANANIKDAVSELEDIDRMLRPPRQRKTKAGVKPGNKPPAESK